LRKVFPCTAFFHALKKGNETEIRLPSGNEAVRIRAMKRLLIRSCLIAGLVCAASCASNKETAVQEPAAAPVMQPEQTAAAARPAPPPPVPVTTSLLPEEGDEGDISGPAVLPGDFRPGLRTPKLPDTLLYDLDGKLITPATP
jgi:hypothetical protein